MGHPDPAGVDAVIEAYKAGIDRSLLRASLKLTPAERIQRLSDLYEFSVSLRRAGREARLGEDRRRDGGAEGVAAP